MSASYAFHLYTIRPSRPAMLAEGPTEDEARIVEAHFAYLQRLTEAGELFLAARTPISGPDSFGFIIINTPDAARARAIMEADPAVAGGVMQAALFPLRIPLLNAAGVVSDD